MLGAVLLLGMRSKMFVKRETPEVLLKQLMTPEYSFPSAIYKLAIGPSQRNDVSADMVDRQKGALHLQRTALHHSSRLILGPTSSTSRTSVFTLTTFRLLVTLGAAFSIAPSISFASCCAYNARLCPLHELSSKTSSAFCVSAV